jgi:hypothetical protein
MSNNGAGKGDKPRPMAVDRSKFNENFDKIFSPKKIIKK